MRSVTGEGRVRHRRRGARNRVGGPLRRLIIKHWTRDGSGKRRPAAHLGPDRVLVLRVERGQPQGPGVGRQRPCGADVLLAGAGPADPGHRLGRIHRDGAKGPGLPGPLPRGPRRSTAGAPVARPRRPGQGRDPSPGVPGPACRTAGPGRPPTTGPCTPSPPRTSSSGRPTNSAGTPGCGTGAQGRGGHGNACGLEPGAKTCEDFTNRPSRGSCPLSTPVVSCVPAAGDVLAGRWRVWFRAESCSGAGGRARRCSWMSAGSWPGLRLGVRWAGRLAGRTSAAPWACAPVAATSRPRHAPCP